MSMRCPRCSEELHERERDGILVDTCPRCRGVWLDRGELEKLIARANAEYERYGSELEGPPSSDRRPYGREHAPHYRKKKSLLGALGDIFD